MRGEVRKPLVNSQALRAKALRERRAEREQIKQNYLAREQAIQVALSKPTRPMLKKGSLDGRIFDVVSKRAPKLLLDEDALEALCRLGRVEKWVRTLETWRPHGKGVMTIFRSLAAHLLALFPMPSFIWQVFFDENRLGALINFAVHVAKGGSPYEAVKSGMLSVPLTRKMCHLLMASKSEDFVEAIRSAQVKALGGDDALVHAWCRRFPELQSVITETFWQTNLPWFCRNPMLDKNQLENLLDYIRHRANQDAHFTLAGRSVLAMMRGMEAWHKELGQAQSHHAKGVFSRSGFNEADFDQSTERNGDKLTLIWHMREILSGSRLADEGRRMSHCVYSYADSVASGKTSIWSLTKDDNKGCWHALTIEVRNADRKIVQARGRFNRVPEPAERAIMQRWANENGLSLF